MPTQDDDGVMLDKEPFDTFYTDTDKTDWSIKVVRGDEGGWLMFTRTHMSTWVPVTLIPWEVVHEMTRLGVYHEIKIEE